MKKSLSKDELKSLLNSPNHSVIFDLDNTIYNEEDFLSQVYFDIAKLSFYKNKDKLSKAHNWLIESLRLEGRGNLYQRYVKEFQLEDKLDLKDFLEIFIQKKRNLSCFPYFPKLASDINNDLFLITNGNPIQQRLKVESLGIENYFKKIIYANEFEKKPDLSSVNEVMKICVNRNFIFIGDSIVDQQLATRAKSNFILVDMNEEKELNFYFKEAKDERVS